jgi:DNA repair exonuclease SbcCD ATPase subunit
MIRDCQNAKVCQSDLSARLLRTTKLVKRGICPTCEQPTAHIRSTEDGYRRRLDKATRNVVTLLKSLERVSKQREKDEDAIGRYHEKLQALSTDLAHSRQLLKQAEDGRHQEKDRNRILARKKSATESGLRKALRIQKAIVSHQKTLGIDREMLEYSKKAFSRNGIPMWLSAGMCPVLNNAASYYSDLFFNSSVTVNFCVEDGEFRVQAVNLTGSQTIDGQSTGEGAKCGLIAAFALRDVMPKTNLLILDEPGTGLDPMSAQTFARGLVKLKSRFETILCCTHNSVIEAELSGERIWVVEKKNGLSRLLM